MKASLIIAISYIKKYINKKILCLFFFIFLFNNSIINDFISNKISCNDIRYNDFFNTSDKEFIFFLY